MEITISEREEKFLMMEYQQVFDSLRTLWNIRMGILGVGISIIGAFINQSVASNITQTQLQFFYSIGMIMSLNFIIKMLGSVTKTLLTLSLRLKDIAKKLNQCDFWIIWGNYAKKNPMDSGTAPLYLICRCINFAVTSCLLYIHTMNVYSALNNTNNFSAMLSILIVVIIVLGFYFNSKLIDKELNISYAALSVIEKWKQANDDTI
jgi:hypothetical protein